MIKDSEVGEWVHGLKEKKHSKKQGKEREREPGRGEEGGRRERGTDRGILPVPLYFQPSVKMNFTS